jgi:hypothetical protein
MKGKSYEKKLTRLIEVIIQFPLQIHMHQLIYYPKLVTLQQKYLSYLPQC